MPSAFNGRRFAGFSCGVAKYAPGVDADARAIRVKAVRGKA